MPKVGKKMSWSSQDTSDIEGLEIKSKLSATGQALVRIASEKVRHILHGYASCQSRGEANDWRHKVMDALIEAFDVLPGSGVFSNRSVCPLCGDGGQGRCNEGFTPEGLRRHLSGWGRFRQCQIIDTTMLLATDHWDKLFRESDLEEKKVKQAELSARMKVETLYRVSPFGEAELANSKYRKEVRDADGMLWAEDRLNSLGFQIVNEDRTKSYVNERLDVVVYADPRFRGGIDFSVYMLPLYKKPGLRATGEMVPPFRITDNLKNDLLRIYEFRINQKG
jgi:hypothetical protein